MHDTLPPFVLGSTAVSSEDRCQRCGLAFEAGTGLHGFERGQLVCDVCTLEHAPREVAAALFSAAQARVARQVRPAHSERILGRAIAGGVDALCALSRDEADALAWALSGLYPHTGAVFEERRRAREAERAREAGRSLPEAGASQASVARLLAASLEASEPERLRARGILEALAGQPFATQQAQLRAVEPRFKTPALCHLLVEESRQLLRDDPRRARELAELACEALSVFDPELLGEAGFHDLQADTCAWLANARRVASDFRAAEAAITKAFDHADRGSGQRLRRAQILDFQGSLRRDQRRFDEALVCLERALAIYRAEGEPSQVAKMLINRAVVLHQAGESESAIPCLRQALALIEPREHPRLVLSATHNLINCQCACQRYQEAQSLFPSARLHIVRHGQRADLLRLEWLHGRVALGLEQGGEAEQRFLGAHAGFLVLGDDCQAALVLLDLASLYLDQRRWDEIARLARIMVPILASRALHREAIAALQLFQQALQSKALTRSFLVRLRRYLKRARHDPDLRFQHRDSLSAAKAASADVAESEDPQPD